MERSGGIAKIARSQDVAAIRAYYRVVTSVDTTFGGRSRGAYESDNAAMAPHSTLQDFVFMAERDEVLFEGAPFEIRRSATSAQQAFEIAQRIGREPEPLKWIEEIAIYHYTVMGLAMEASNAADSILAVIEQGAG